MLSTLIFTLIYTLIFTLIFTLIWESEGRRHLMTGKLKSDTRAQVWCCFDNISKFQAPRHCEGFLYCNCKLSSAYIIVWLPNIHQNLYTVVSPHNTAPPLTASPSNTTANFKLPLLPFSNTPVFLQSRDQQYWWGVNCSITLILL